MAVPFDLAALEVTGDSVPVVQGVRQTPGTFVDYALSEEGTLVYVPAGSSESLPNSLVWVDREGKETSVSEEKRDFGSPRISPDGTQVAVAIAEGDTQGLWALRISTSKPLRVTAMWK